MTRSLTSEATAEVTAAPAPLTCITAEQPVPIGGTPQVAPDDRPQVIVAFSLPVGVV